MNKLRFKVGDKVQVRKNEKSYFHRFSDIQKLENECVIVTITHVCNNGGFFGNGKTPCYNVTSTGNGRHCLNDDNLMWSLNKRLE